MAEIESTSTEELRRWAIWNDSDGDFEDCIREGLVEIISIMWDLS